MIINLGFKDKTYEVEMEPTQSVDDLKQKIDNMGILAQKKQKLYYNQNELIEGTIEENSVCEGKTIHIVRKTKLTNRCQYPTCNKKTILIVGDCSWCKSSFCHSHRLPESHQCINYSDCKKNSFDRNAELVGNMKCVSSKV